MTTLAELLRLKQAENPEERAYIGYPQISNRPRQEGAVSGFLANASGLPAKENLSVLNPQDVAYMQGQNYGDLANIGLMATGVPALLRAMPKNIAKTATIKLDPIGQALENRRLSDYPSLVKEYNLLEDSRGGKHLNTDTARELSPEYLKNRTLAASVHEPSSSFIKQRYAEILSQPAPEGSTVVFTAGGTGAGKSSSLDAFPSITKNAEIVYDTNMNTLSSAEKKINQALEAGRNVDILYTYRDPEKALRVGSLQRAVRQKEKFGSGRTVPMKEHLRTHEGSREVIEQLQKKYEGDPRVRIGLVDNSYGLGEQKVVNDINQLPRYNVEEMGKRLMKALEEEYKAGNITKEIYESSK